MTSTLVYYNDIEHYPCEVLRKNIALGNLPEGFVDERDIREVSATDILGYGHVHLFAGIGGFALGFEWAGVPKHIRILTGGFPCQDISNAGKRAGITGERSGLWKEMDRLIQESLACDMGFDYIVVENVAALVNRGLSTVLGDLAQAGYDAEWRVLRASDFGAPHQRERIFIVAYPNIYRQRIRQNQQERQPSSVGPTDACDDGTKEHVADTQSHDARRVRSRNEAEISRPSCGSEILADASSSGRQECNITSIAGEQGHTAWRKIAPGTSPVESSTGRRERQYRSTGRPTGAQPLSEQSGTGHLKPVMGGDTYGLSYRMDRSLWPAGPGQKQYDWEPSRTITERQPQRVARLKALGNAIVSQITQYIGYLIINHYQQTHQRERVAASLDYKNTDHSSWIEAHGSEAM